MFSFSKMNTFSLYWGVMLLDVTLSSEDGFYKLTAVSDHEIAERLYNKIRHDSKFPIFTIA